MTTRTLTAMFPTSADAERAAQMLVSELHLSQASVRVSPGQGAIDTGYDKARPYEEKGFFGSLKDMFLPEEDRYAYAEGMRRGAVLLSAQVEEAHVSRASEIIERAGAVDLDAQEATWKQSGWTGYDATAHKAVASAAAPARADQDDTIKVVEEQLVVGKRAAEAGSVRVRSYVVERPVEAQVKLREEAVTIERHAVNRPVSAADLDAFGEKTIEAREVDEVAVVGKEARVIEEIGIRKEAADRTETVRDTVRKTEVEVEDTTQVNRTAGASVTGNTGATKAATRK